mmetsp:Transcript_80386/g.260553  ORF Transcript_80386/g.260553 Transcript_80386/m.260553 type:complete len:209 (+) Transcript_80386:706-1332(+)
MLDDDGLATGDAQGFELRTLAVHPGTLRNPGPSFVPTWIGNVDLGLCQEPLRVHLADVAAHLLGAGASGEEDDGANVRLRRRRRGRARAGQARLGRATPAGGGHRGVARAALRGRLPRELPGLLRSAGGEGCVQGGPAEDRGPQGRGFLRDVRATVTALEHPGARARRQSAPTEAAAADGVAEVRLQRHRVAARRGRAPGEGRAGVAK